MNYPMLLIGILTGLALFAAWATWHSFFRVDEGHLGVLVDFGAAERAEGHAHRLRTYGPGLHRKAPWKKVIRVQMAEQILDLSGERARSAMAADGTILRLDSILRYQPIEERLDEYLFGMRSPREHMTGLFTSLLRNEIANFGTSPGTESNARALELSLNGPSPVLVSTHDMGSFALLRRERSRLNQEIAAFCHGAIGNRYGLRFNAVDLVDILPPDELAAALNAVIYAHTEAGTRYYRAEGDCQQRVLAAEEGLEIAKQRASSVEREMTKLAEFLTRMDDQDTLVLYVKRRRAEVFGEARTLYVNQPA